MYSGTSYGGGNPYLVGGGGYLTTPAAAAAVASSSATASAGGSSGSLSSLASPYTSAGLGGAGSGGVPRSSSAPAGASGVSSSSGSSLGASYLSGAGYAAMVQLSVPLAPLTAPPTTAAPSSLSSSSTSLAPASSSFNSTAGNGSSSNPYASPLLSGTAVSSSSSSSSNVCAQKIASPYSSSLSSAPPYAGASVGGEGTAALRAKVEGGSGSRSSSGTSSGSSSSGSRKSRGCACGGGKRIDTGAAALSSSPSSPCSSPRASSPRAGSGVGRRSNKGRRPSSQIRVEVADTELGPGEEEPTYHLKLNMNGRGYVAARTHAQLRMLVEVLQGKGYVLPLGRPFPEVRDVMAQAPVKVMAADDRLVEALPFYEGFGYSIKALASTVLRSSAAAGLRSRRRSFLVEQVTQRVEAFLKALFAENDDLQYEQEVYQFFWEPLQKKLPPVLEEAAEGSDWDGDGSEDDEGGHCDSGDGTATEESSSEGEDDEGLAARCAAALGVRA